MSIYDSVTAPSTKSASIYDTSTSKPQPAAAQPTVLSKIAATLVPPAPTYAASLYDQVKPTAPKAPSPILDTASNILASFLPFGNAIKTAIAVVPAEISEAISGFKNTPVAPKTTDFVAGIGGGTQQAASTAFQSGVASLDKLASAFTNNSAPVLQRVAQGGNAAVGVVNSIFGIVLSPLQGYATVPVLGSAIDGVNKVFGAMGEGAGAGAVAELNNLPISQLAKATLTPFIHDTASLAGQIVGGKLVGDLGKASVAKLMDNSKAIMTELSNDPAIKAAITAHQEAPPAAPAPTTNQLARTIQQQMPSLPASRVYDIAERANELTPEGQSAFIKAELAKINPSSLPTYRSETITATAHDTTPIMAANEAARPTEDNQPATAYEPYTPPDQLPVIRMGAKPKSDIPTINADTPTVRKVPGDLTIEPIKSAPAASPTRTAQPTERPTPSSSALTEPHPKPLSTEPGVSKIGKSIEAKAIEAGLTKGFDTTARYGVKNVPDQIKRTSELVANDIEEARAIVRGEKPVPDGMSPVMLVDALEEYIKTNPDAQLIHELANSPLVSGTSYAAQEMRLAQERTPDSLTAQYNAIKTAKEATAAKKHGDIRKAESRIVNDEHPKLQKQISNQKVTPKTWAAFLEEIKCNY